MYLRVLCGQLWGILFDVLCVFVCFHFHYFSLFFLIFIVPACFIFLFKPLYIYINNNKKEEKKERETKLKLNQGNTRWYKKSNRIGKAQLSSNSNWEEVIRWRSKEQQDIQGWLTLHRCRGPLRLIPTNWINLEVQIWSKQRFWADIHLHQHCIIVSWQESSIPRSIIKRGNTFVHYCQITRNR